jgi:hypothetical protein
MLATGLLLHLLLLLAVAAVEVGLLSLLLLLVLLALLADEHCECDSSAVRSYIDLCVFADKTVTRMQQSQCKYMIQIYVNTIQ